MISLLASTNQLCPTTNHPRMVYVIHESESVAMAFVIVSKAKGEYEMEWN